MKYLKISLLASALCFSLNSTAQKLPFTNNNLRNNLEKVVSDFPRELSSIRGEEVMANPQTIEYATTLDLEGVESNTITKFIANKPIYSWKALVLTTEEFTEAESKYKWLTNQLKVMTLTLEGGSSFTLSGDYEAPHESKKFFVSSYRLTPAATALPKLQIQVSMEYMFPEWEVSLVIFQKEREDKDRGKRVDD